MANKKLVVHEHFEGRLFGIVSQLRDYQICWHLNKALGTELVMMDELEFTNRKKHKTSVYTWFRYESELDMWLMYLISNKHQGDFFLPELKQADYIFMIRGEVSDERGEEILSAIRSVHAVQLAVQVNYSKLKSKENLVLE
jgi:hypothetical protein